MSDLAYLNLGPRRGMRRATSAVDWYERGLGLEAIDPGAAVAAYGRAIAGRPDLPDAHNNLGRLLHDRGELAAAESCYRLALCLDARSALYWFNLGVVLEDLGRVAEAIAAYERALALDARMADAHFNLANQIERIARLESNDVLASRAARHFRRYHELSRAHG